MNQSIYMIITGVVIPVVLCFTFLAIRDRYMNKKLANLIKCVARKELTTITSSTGVRHLLNRLIHKHKLDNLTLMEKFDVLDSYYKHRQHQNVVYEDLDMLVLIGLIVLIIDDTKDDSFYIQHINSMIDVLHVYEIELTTHDGIASKILNTYE